MIGCSLDANAVSTHFQALANELVRRGHLVVVVAPATDWSPASGFAGRFNVARWPSKRPTGLADAAFLWRLIGRYGPDVIIANFGAINWMCLVGWLRRVRCRVAWYHTLSSQISLDWNRTPQWLGFLRLRKRLVYRWATHLAVNSCATLTDVGKTYGVPADKCKVWRNSLPDPEPSLGLCGSLDREDLVVCAGRFNRTKGQDVLIEALALCGEKLGTTRIEFLGIGPLLDSVRARAGELGLLDRCAFRGAVSHAEVLRRMGRAHLTVVPSRTEAFGLVNIESMAVGTPVLTSGVDGILEIVRDGVDGFLVSPDDPVALADRLATLLRDATLRQTLGANARQRFLEVYEQSRVVAAQADWLEGIASPAVDSPPSVSPSDSATRETITNSKEML